MRVSQSALIQEVAWKILDYEPEQAIQYRLLRDVLRVPKENRRLISLRKILYENPHVRRLETEQRKDGSWGGFHCGRHSAKYTIPNTETGIERALALGLDAKDPILRKTISYITELLERRRPFPESEKNDRFKPGWRMFAASRLSLIDPGNPVLDEPWSAWCEILKRTFSSGEYDSIRENKAHEELHGIRSEIRYLHLRNKYAVALLGSRADRLPKKIEKVYAKWLWLQRKGMGYLDINFSVPPIGRDPYGIERWFVSQELFSLYPTGHALAKEVIKWLWEQSNEEGLWDLGPRSTFSCYFPLSETWRKKGIREQDWSVRVLSLLTKYINA